MNFGCSFVKENGAIFTLLKERMFVYNNHKLPTRIGGSSWKIRIGVHQRLKDAHDFNNSIIYE